MQTSTRKTIQNRGNKTETNAQLQEEEEPKNPPVVQLAEKTFEEKRNDVSLRDLLYLLYTPTILLVLMFIIPFFFRKVAEPPQ